MGSANCANCRWLSHHGIQCFSPHCFAGAPDRQPVLCANADQPCTQQDTIRMNPDRACATKLSLTKKACVPDRVKMRSGFFCSSGRAAYGCGLAGGAAGRGGIAGRRVWSAGGVIVRSWAGSWAWSVRSRGPVKNIRPAQT